MKTVLRFLLVGIVLAALTAGWVYLYTHSRAVDAEKQNVTLGMLKDLKQLDSDWNTNVLKSQAEIISSYDALTKPLRRFSEIFGLLDGEIKRLNDAELKTALTDIRLTIEKKTALIDRFKAQNSLLKNSLRYAPTAYKDIQDQMRSQRDVGMLKGSKLMVDVPGAFDELEKSLVASKAGSGAMSNQQIDVALAKLRVKMKSTKQADAATKSAFTLVNLDNNVSALVGEALRYNSVPDSETAELLKVGIEKMREASASYPVSVQESVDNLMAHLDAILQLRNKQINLLQEISSIPVVSKIEALNNGLMARFDAELKQQFDYQRLLLAYSAFALILVFGAAGIITYRNATERKRLIVLVDRQTRELKDNEVQLVHAQKMNALGEMVAGITHEVNTPLAAVKSGLQSSLDLIGVVREYVDESGKMAVTLSAPPPADDVGRAQRKVMLGKQLAHVNELREELVSFEALSTIDQLLGEGVKNVEYIHQVVVNMLNFSRLDRSRISEVKIEEGIENTLVIAKHFLKKVQVTKEYGNTPVVNCDIAQINQVLLNLIKNAAQAFDESGGEIKITTTATTSNEIKVAIIDNGMGIPNDILDKIWEPFFTTKKAGSGTGLGLSTCKKIVSSHGGRIDVSSVVGTGTTFTIILPVTPPASLYEEHGQEANSQFLATA